MYANDALQPIESSISANADGPDVISGERDRILRVWLGCGRPLMPTFAAWLLNQIDADGLPIANFGRTAIVCATGRSCRIVLGELVDRAHAVGFALVPPILLTPGEVGEAILLGSDGGVGHGLRPAGAITRELVWSAALRDTPEVSATLLAHPPARDEADAWLRHARVIAGVSDELGRAGRRFADVVPVLQSLTGFPDVERWDALGRAQQAYEHILAARGLVDPVLGCVDALAQCAASNKSLPFAAAFDRVILVGGVRVPDLGQRALKLVPDVVACVHASEEHAGAFDTHGAPITKVWADAATSPLALRDDQMLWTRSTSDAAEQALLSVCEDAVGDACELDPSGAVLVVPDAALASELSVLAADLPGVEIRDARGTPLDHTLPVRAIRSVLSIASDSIEGVRSALANPLITAWLQRSRVCDAAQLECTRRDMDQVQEKSPTGSIADIMNRLDSDSPAVEVLSALMTCARLFPPDAPHSEHECDPDICIESLRKLVASLRVDNDPANTDMPDPDADWASLDTDRDSAAFDMLEACINEAADAMGVVLVHPKIAAVAGVVVELTRQRRVPPPVRSGVLDLIGWGELPADPRPRVAIMGMAEGSLSRPQSDFALLTETARRALGLSDDLTRLGDDAYALWSAMSGRERFRIVVPKETPEGQPLVPGRLLFFGSEPNTATRTDDDCAIELSTRVLKFVDPEPVRTAVVRGNELQVDAAFSLPSGLAMAGEVFSVSSFASYLRSPAMFYLERVLGARIPQPSRLELDAMAYGNVLHDVLSSFKDHPAALSTDHERVRSGLLETFADVRAKQFGLRTPAAIRVQLELAMHRIDRVARWHAAERNAGWLIQAAEWEPTTNQSGDPKRCVPLDVDGVLAWISGRIDRIDRHEGSGAIRVIDYKTGERPTDPKRAHLSSSGWCDLQLPLYRWLVEQHGVDPSSLVHPGTRSTPLARGAHEVEVGYVSIHRDASDIGFVPFVLDDNAYSEAMGVARAVIRSVRGSNFREHDLGASTLVGGAGRPRTMAARNTDAYPARMMQWLAHGVVAWDGEPPATGATP